MELTLNEVSETMAELTIEVQVQQVQREFNKHYSEVQKEIVLPGFRKGKVPRTLLRQRFGKQIEAEIAQEMATDLLQKAIEEKKLRPVGEPKVSTLQIAEGQPFRMVVQIEHFPVIELARYKGLAPEAKPIEVTDAEVQKQLRQVRLNEAKRTEVSRPAQSDDYVEGRFLLYVDGALEGPAEPRKFEVNIGEDQFFSGSLVDRKFIGHQAGDKFTIEATVPSDYAIERMRSKPMTLEIELEKVSEQELPELTEEFVQERFGKSYEALVQENTQKIKESKEFDQRQERLEVVFDTLRNANQFPVPEVLIAKEKENEEKRWEKDGLSEAERVVLRKTQQERIERKVRNALLLQRVIELEKFEVTRFELHQRFTMMGALWGQPADVMQSFYESQPRLLQNLKDDILEKKALDFLLETNSSLIVEV